VCAGSIDLLQQTIPQGLTLPTLTDFIELSVGGMLSVGGIGSQSFRYGPQVENRTELEVVTGEGELVVCSPSQQAHLFDAVRCGPGLFGIIVGTRVRLITAPPMARLYHAFYSDLVAFLADLETLADDGRFDTVQGFALPNGAGGWQFQLETTTYFTPGQEPNGATLLAGLSFVPGTQSAQDLPDFDYRNRLAPLVAFLKQIGVWSLPHPWVDLFVPAVEAATFRWAAATVNTRSPYAAPSDHTPGHTAPADLAPARYAGQCPRAHTHPGHHRAQPECVGNHAGYAPRPT